MTTKNFRFSSFELDPIRRVLNKDGEPVPLNPKALDLLLVLVESRGQVLSKDDLLARVWPGQFVEEGNLKVHISALRKAFNTNKNDHRFIVTVPGRGYSFVAEVAHRPPELIVESHRISKIVVDEETENGSATEVDKAAPLLPAKFAPMLAHPFAYMAAATLLLAGLGITVWYFLGTSQRGSKFESIAVMPFTNDSGEAEAEYLSDGLTDSLINYLSQLTTVSVKGPSSVSRYKGKQVSPEQIGSELGVQALLNGRVAQRGDQLIFYISLVDAGTGDQIWGEQYVRKPSDLASLQNEIAREVSRKLIVKLSSVDKGKLAKNYTANSEAYLLYLKGRYYSNKRSPKDLRRAIELFEHATQLDPNFALAFAGLADSYSLLSNYGGSLPHETKPKARTAALRALSIDESLPEAHTALGGILGDYDYDFAGEEREYKRAIELNPNLATAHHWYGELLARTGRHEEAAEEFKKALDLDPLSLTILRSQAESLFYARRYDESLSQLANLRELEPEFSSVYVSLAYLNQMKGNFAESAESYALVYERMLGQKHFADKIRASFSQGGWNWFLREMTGRNRPANLPYYVAATFHAALGNKDGAIADLNRSFELREPFIPMLKSDPRLDPLRDDPRFVELLTEVGY